MTTTTQTHDNNNDIFNCKLRLVDGSEFRIPLREDGYIHGTEICKVASKKIHNWLRLNETMQLENVLKKQNPNKIYIDVKKGGLEQGTWIHPDLAFNLIQWCSTEFSIQVSKWLLELVFTGNVELGNEKTSEVMDEKYQEALYKLKETEEELKQTKVLVEAYDEKNKELTKKYRQMQLNHQSYLRHKELYKLKTGPCVYIIDMKKTPDDTDDIKRYKIGQTGDITNRVSGFRTSNPFCKVISIIYSAHNIDLERNLKIKYEKQLFPINSEFITGISKEKLQEDALQIADILNIDYTIETEDELAKFNGHIITENDVELDVVVVIPEGFKRCGGQYHKTEDSRQQPLTKFFKQKCNKDGYSRLCKECYSTSKYGEDRRQRKIVDIPKYDVSSSKWCNVCESVKEHKEFYPDKNKKDGLNSNCKSCRTDLKRKYKELKQQQKDGENHPQITPVVIQEAKNPLERFSKVELIHLCKEKGITVSIKKTKPEMIKMLS